MGNFNKVFLMGNLTRDIEMKAISSGQQVARIGLAINRNFTLQSGEKREEVTYVDCEAWGKTAEVMAKYLTKGRPVFIEGRLKYDAWQDKDGNKRSAIRVVVETFQFIGGREGGGAGGGGNDGGGFAASGAPSQGNWSRGNAAPAPMSDEPDSQLPPNDDIPF